MTSVVDLSTGRHSFVMRLLSSKMVGARKRGFHVGDVLLLAGRR